MKKGKVFCLLAVLVGVVLMATACGSGDSSGSPEASKPGFSAEDMGIEVQGVWYPIRKDASALLAVLGEDFTLSASPSCVFEGEDKEFAFSNCLVYTNPDGEKDIWYQIALLDESLATSKGAKVGDTTEKVIDLYGDGFYWEGETIFTYSISGVAGDIASPCHMFTIENGVVTQIDIYYPTNVTA